MDNKLRICTFNCTGYKSSEIYIRDILCTKYHLIALQETWLLPHELAKCDSLHNDFSAFAISSVDVGRGVVRGRPYGGLGWLWPKTLDGKIKPVTFDDSRILGLVYDDGKCSVLFVNVYMPTQCTGNNLEFLRILGKLSSITEESNTDAVCLVGDWNANVNTYYYNELEEFCRENSLMMVDIDKLPSDSYTHLSDVHNTTSW